MEIEIEVNGQPAEVLLEGNPGFSEIRVALETDLREKGWKISEIRVDGIRSDGGACPVDLQDGRLHRIEVGAVPSSDALAEITGQLQESLPHFRRELTELGQAFARGEWRASLERLTAVLEELHAALVGLRLVAEAGGTADEATPREVQARLEELSVHIERRSWVEVSDLLLYELVPLLQDRAHGA